MSTVYTGVGFFIYFPTVATGFIDNGTVTGVKWSAILTGAPDGVPDLDLISVNLNATLRDDTASYIQVVIPFSQLDDVLARSNGQIVIFKTLLPNGSPVELYRVNFNDMRIDEGARNRKITISGRSTAAFPAPSLVTLAGVVSDDIQASGARTLAVSPFNDVIPGDSILYDSEITTIDLVQITANSGGTQMRLTQA